MAQIKRSTGDETAVKISWSGEVDLTSVTAVSMRVYGDSDKTALVETLTGEIRGFDPATYFPIINANWTGTRYWQVVLTRTAEDQPLPTLHTWVQA